MLIIVVPVAVESGVVLWDLAGEQRHTHAEARRQVTTRKSSPSPLLYTHLCYLLRSIS